MPTINYPGTPGTTLYGGIDPAALLTTLSFVNTSGSEQATGFVSPMFGLPLKQGDVPAGEYPVFQLENGTECPATLWGITTWPDGSMKFCAGMVRVPSTVAGSGTLTIEVKSGGDAPAASARSTSDLTAADLSVVLTGVTNLSGDWTASLNTAITDDDETVVIGDGPAGKVWRIRGSFKQSGSPHGQLECYHYVAALQDGSGDLMGLRYLGRVAQPWADVASPTPTRRVATAVLKSGASTLRTLQGHDTTETPGDNIAINHYSSFYTCGTDAKWDYVQGGGSASADCTIRVQHDNAHLVLSKLVPPYDLEVSTSSSTTTNYYPYGRGPHGVRDIDTTGNSNFIGVLPMWAVRHLINQTVDDERAVRVGGLVAAGWRATLRDSASGQIIPVVDVQASYPGMGTVQTSWRYVSTNRVGVQNPTVTTSLWSGDTNTSHRGSAAYYPYLITGEPQYLDILEEHAAQAIMQSIPATAVLRTEQPITSLFIGEGGDYRNKQIGTGGTIYKGAGLCWQVSNTRTNAWAVRDVVQAIGVLPDDSPSKPYFEDVLTSAVDSVLALNATRPSSWQDSGMFTTHAASYNASDIDARLESPWQLGYYALAIAHGADLTKNPSVEAFRDQWGKFYKTLQDDAALIQATAYRILQFNADGTFVMDTADLLFYNGDDIVFSAAANTGTVSQLWSPTNGDVFAFFSDLTANKPFPEATDGTRFYAVNCSGKTFQLAASPGGSPIDVPSDITVSLYMARLQNFDPELFVGDNNYVGIMSSAIRYMLLSGDTTLAAAKTKIDASVTGLPLNFSTDPRNAMADAYPE